VSHLTGWSFGYIALLSFWTVFLAELVGDKSIYSIASLSIRYSAAAVFSGITLAFAGKMLVAVLLVRLLVHLHFGPISLAQGAGAEQAGGQAKRRLGERHGGVFCRALSHRVG